MADVHPTKPEREYTIRVVAPTRGKARRLAVGLSPLGLRIRGIEKRGKLVARSTRELGEWGVNRG